MNGTDIYAPQGYKQQDAGLASKFVEQMRAVIGQDTYKDSHVARSVLAAESLSADAVNDLNQSASNLSSALESIAADLNMFEAGDSFTSAQKKAAGIANILSADPEAFLNTPLRMPTQQLANESMGVVEFSAMARDGMVERATSLEAYDNRENRSSAMYSIFYNMQAARQDDFGETLYPTVVVSPENVGFGVTVRLVTVYNGITRSVSGALQDFNRINIIRALADWEVLRNEQTRLYPVYRSGTNDAYFVPPSEVASSTVVIGGADVTTGPLVFGSEMDLLGLSQTAALLANGSMDETDTIDPHIVLENVYMSATDGTNTDYLKLPTQNIPLSNFTFTPQSNYRIEQLLFNTTSIVLDASTTQADGSALVALAALVSNNWVARLSMRISGSCNIETGATVLYANSVSLYSLQDSTGATVSTSSGAGQTLAGYINGMTFLGYDLIGWRTNMNRRTRGQILNITFYTQLYSVPLRSPITAIHPVTVDVANDTTSLTALITATHIRTSNDAVTSLTEAETLLASYANTNAIGPNLEGPELLGVGRYLVKPYYANIAVDISTEINSLRSADRVADIQAVLVNYIRDQAYRMWRDSEYMAAAKAVYGGNPKPPTVIVATDPVLARYLTVTGDLRTLGNDFDVRIVSTLDSRVKGSIYVTFGDFTGDVNAGPNPLHWGCMAYKPELTLTLPISRGGQMSKELTVQPSYLHIVNCPVLTVLSVTNIPSALGSIAVPTHSV